MQHGTSLVNGTRKVFACKSIGRITLDVDTMHVCEKTDRQYNII